MNERERWAVYDHGVLTALTENVWFVDGSLPKMPLRRNMTAVRRADGTLLIHNAVALNDESMTRLESLGAPRAIIVPNGWHRIDAPRFAARYTDARVYCPRGARKKVAEVVAVDGTYEDFRADDVVSVETLDGLGEREGVFKVRSADGVTLIFNDTVFNQPRLPGVWGTVYHWIGSTGAPKVTSVMKLVAIKDKRALSSHLHRLADEPDLKRIIPGHGTPIVADAPNILHAIANQLSH